MVNTIPYDIMRSCFGIPFKSVKLTGLLNIVTTDLTHAQNSLNAAQTVRDADYYSGMVDAYHIVATLLAPVKNKKLLDQCIGKDGTRDAIVAAIRAAS